MKQKNTIVFSIFVLTHVLILCSLPISAQDYTRQNLPEGAKIRLGKGLITDTGKHVVQFSPDGTRLAVATSIGIRLYETQTYQEVALLTGPNSWINNVSFSPNGQMLASSSSHGVYLWNVSTGTLHKTFKNESPIYRHTSVSFSPDGRTLASGEEERIHLWDISTGALQETFTANTGYLVRSTTFSPDGQTLVSGGSDGIYLWDISTGALQETFWTNSIYVFSNVAFSPDGRMLAGGGYNAFDDLPSVEVDGDNLLDRLLGSGDEDDNDCKSINPWTNGIIGLWDVSTGTLRIPHTEYIGEVTSVSFSPNGRMLASAGWDGIRLWDASTSIRLKTLAVSAESVAFSPDGRTLASGAPDGTVLLWDLTLITGRLIERTPLTLEALTIPTKTALLQNYPNPFNPETWIPYQLEESTRVSLCVYSANGTLIRTLFSCAEHEAGTYRSPDRAAYWDGKNDVGEPVTNGIYFYTLTAGEATSTRKMIIRK